MTGVQEVSHLGPFRGDDPAYALALPIEQVAVRSEVAAERAPVWEAMLDEGYGALLTPRLTGFVDRAAMARAYWTTGPGGEPIQWTKGDRDTCSLCGRDTALRRDGRFVRHNNPATGQVCVGFNPPPEDGE